jgi:hypothetical protein
MRSGRQDSGCPAPAPSFPASRASTDSCRCPGPRRVGSSSSCARRYQLALIDERNPGISGLRGQFGRRGRRRPL